MYDERLLGATSAGVGEDNGMGTNAEVDDTFATRAFSVLYRPRIGDEQGRETAVRRERATRQFGIPRGFAHKTLNIDKKIINCTIYL